MGAQLEKPLSELNCEELCLLVSKTLAPPCVESTIRKNHIDGATVLELDENTVQSLGATLIEKKQLLGAYHKCVARTISLPPLIRSPQARRSRGEYVPRAQLNKKDATHLRKHVVIETDNQFTEILRSMRDFKNDPEVQQFGAKQLGKLAAEDAESKSCAGRHGAVQAVIQSMQSCPGDRRVQTDSAYALSQLMKDHSENLKTGRKNNAIESLRNALRTFKGDTDLEEHCTNALDLLGEEVERIPNVPPDEHGIGALVQTMQDRGDDVGVQERGCWAIGTLASDTSVDIHRQIISFGGHVAVLDALNRFGSSNVNLVEHGMQALVYLASNRRNRPELMRTTFLRTVNDCIYNNGENHKIQRLGCKAFEMFANKKRFQDAVQEAKGASTLLWVIVRGIEEHINGIAFALGVLESGCKALGNLCLNNVVVQHEVCQSNGLDILSRCMKLYPDEHKITPHMEEGRRQVHESLQKHVVILFGLLASVPEYSIDAGNKGIAAVLAAMHQFPKVPALQQSASMLLYYALHAQQVEQDANNSSRSASSEECGKIRVSIPDTTPSAFDQDPGLCKTATELLLIATSVHSTDPLVIVWAIRALGLTVEYPSGRSQCTEMSGTASVLMIMDSFPQNLQIQQVCCYTLGRMVSNHPGNRTTVRQQGGIHKLLETMTRFKPNSALQQAGCDTLGNLASGPTVANQRAIHEAGGLDLVFQAMQDFPDSPGIQQAACQALYFLGWENEVIQSDIIQCDGLKMIEMSLQHHPWHPGVQYWGANAIMELNEDAAEERKNKSPITKHLLEINSPPHTEDSHAGKNVKG